jgi:hypothetical protein
LRFQEVTVNTVPSDANCTFIRNGQRIAEVSRSPGSAVIKKTGADLMIDCTKPGYQDASVVDRSDVAAATFGNLILGGLIGVIIDAVDGSIHKYDAAVAVTLVPKLPASAGSPTRSEPPAT